MCSTVIAGQGLLSDPLARMYAHATESSVSGSCYGKQVEMHGVTGSMHRSTHCLARRSDLCLTDTAALAAVTAADTASAGAVDGIAAKADCGGHPPSATGLGAVPLCPAHCAVT